MFARVVMWMILSDSCAFIARFYAQRSYADNGKLSARVSVHLSVCPSVCKPCVRLRYRGHIGWNSWKIISRLIDLTYLLSADPNIMDLLQRKTAKFYPE